MRWSVSMIFFLIVRPPPSSPLFPYTTLFRSCQPAPGVCGPHALPDAAAVLGARRQSRGAIGQVEARRGVSDGVGALRQDRKSTRLNSSHSQISYAVFCLKKKINTTHVSTRTH